MSTPSTVFLRTSSRIVIENELEGGVLVQPGYSTPWTFVPDDVELVSIIVSWDAPSFGTLTFAACEDFRGLVVPLGRIHLDMQAPIRFRPRIEVSLSSIRHKVCVLRIIAESGTVGSGLRVQVVANERFRPRIQGSFELVRPMFHVS